MGVSCRMTDLCIAGVEVISLKSLAIGKAILLAYFIYLSQ